MLLIFSFLNRFFILSGFQNSGFLIKFQDVCGPYSSLIFSISNTFAALWGIGVPYLIGGLAFYNNHHTYFVRISLRELAISEIFYIFLSNLRWYNTQF
jgi:hypothetical protein